MTLCFRTAVVVISAYGAGSASTCDARDTAEAVPASAPIAACTSTPVVTSVGSMKLSVAASRASGVAPLSVFFDTSGTVSSTTAKPFHDIEYRWNFGESSGPGVGPWSQGSGAGKNSRNTATGPLAAHVYEVPGTYTVSVSEATDAASYQCQITVQDPDVVFAGSKTTCFSTSGLFQGCPVGANRVTTSDFAAVKAAATPTNAVRRLLLRRGEKWTASATANFALTGPGLIGAFGTGARPVVQTAIGFRTESAVVSFSSAVTPLMKDWRLMDVTIDGSPNVGTKAFGVGTMGGIDQLTILRVNPNALRLGVMLVDNLLDIWNADANPARHGHKIWDQLSIVDMDITRMPAGTPGDASSYSYGTYLSGERVFYAGNAIDGRGTSTPGVSHNARFSYLGKAIISNNTLMRAGPTQHSLKLHAASWGNTGVAGARGIGEGYTRWVVIADNKFVGGHGGWPVTIGPQDGVHDERGRDIILERNWHVAGPATQWHQVIWFSDVTTRNNIIDMSGSASHGGIFVSQRAGFQVPADQVRVYNNTFYSPDTANDFVAVQLHPKVTNVVVKNNLAFAPNDSTRLMIRGTGDASAPLVESNNSKDLRIDPLFVGPFSSPAGFKTRAGSYARGAGISSKVFSDFLGAGRPTNAAPDIGSTTH